MRVRGMMSRLASDPFSSKDARKKGWPSASDLYAHEVGPNFAEGLTRIGRGRLPRGYVAILDDPATLKRAIHELRDYAVRGDGNQPIRGIVYRVVSDGESEAIRHKLHEKFGGKGYRAATQHYHVPAGQRHVIDSSSLRHITNRHTGSANPKHPSELPLTDEDLEMIPEVVGPKNIEKFEPGSRIRYQRELKDGQFVGVEEIRTQAGLSLVTLFKNKKGRGGHPAGA